MSPEFPFGLPFTRRWVQDHLDKGVRCPCCDQWAQEYTWSLYSTAARALILYYRIGGTERFVHTNEIKALGHQGQGDAARLSFWGLVEREKERREDGGRSGYWRVTTAGEDFVLGREKIPKYADVYNREVRRLHGDFIGISDALGEKFDYDKLMGR